MGLQDILVHGLALGKVTGLYRHAVKGLSADAFDQVTLTPQDGTFPDDRRFALMKLSDKNQEFDEDNPAWLHKENFLCVFTDPHLMARYRASYAMTAIADDPAKVAHGSPGDKLLKDGKGGDKVLSLFERSTDDLVLGPIDLATEAGRQALADFFSKEAKVRLKCVTAENHQFGNTSKGWKKKQDTRTIHIVNESTVKALEAAIADDAIVLDPTRFRPNIVIRGDTEPFSEFEWVGKSIQCGSSLELEVISKTVRCRGIGVDPLQPNAGEIDIPHLLMKHFPKEGPYLGVYAIVTNGGVLSLDDKVTLL